MPTLKALDSILPIWRGKRVGQSAGLLGTNNVPLFLSSSKAAKFYDTFGLFMVGTFQPTRRTIEPSVHASLKLSKKTSMTDLNALFQSLTNIQMPIYRSAS
jgi:hypothetical protein